MNHMDFKEVKDRFVNSDIDEKILIYTQTSDLTKAQYLDLLKFFPRNEINRLELALSEI